MIILHACIHGYSPKNKFMCIIKSIPVPITYKEYHEPLNDQHWGPEMYYYNMTYR